MRLAAWAWLALLLAGLLAGCQGGSSQVAVSLRMDPRNIGDFRQLPIQVESVGIQPAGRNHDAGWLDYAPTQRNVDLKRLADGSAAEIAHLDVPAGRYGRIFVRVEDPITGILTDGRAT